MKLLKYCTRTRTSKFYKEESTLPLPPGCSSENIAVKRRTPWALGTSMKEHQTATGIGETVLSVMAERIWAEQHHPIWDGVPVIGKDKNVDFPQIKEGFCFALAGKKNCS